MTQLTRFLALSAQLSFRIWHCELRRLACRNEQHCGGKPSFTPCVLRTQLQHQKALVASLQDDLPKSQQESLEEGRSVCLYIKEVEWVAVFLSS
jgi:hypothetical protein